QVIDSSDKLLRGLVEFCRELKVRNFHGRFLRFEKISLQSCATLRHALKSLNDRSAGKGATASPQPSVTSGNRRMAARLSSVVRCVYWRETAALSCPMISRAIKSETPAAFSIVTALWRKLWNEISLASRAWSRPLPVLLCPRGSSSARPAVTTPQDSNCRFDALILKPRIATP